MKKQLVKAIAICTLLVMIIGVFPIGTITVKAANTISVADLKAQYPEGKYWNGKNPNTYTSTPCNHHGRCSYSGSCGCNTFNKQAIQCMGFAYQLGHLVFGGNPYRDWRKNYSVSALNTLKPGDVIRLNHNRHSIFVTAVNGETVTYADCNSDGHCIIRWDKKITKSKIRASFSYVAVAPKKWDMANHVHKYKNEITKATLTSNGKVVVKCVGCGKTKSTSTTYKVTSFKLSATSYTYDGKVKKPTVVVKDSKGNILKNGTDYSVTYSSGRKNVGTYKVTVKLKGNYSGTKTLTFKIKPVDISKCKVVISKTSYSYDGKIKTPTVTIKNQSGGKLTNGLSYTVTYSSGRKNVGTYKVTVKLKGNYSGTKTLTFNIIPKAASINKLTAGSKSIEVKLNRSLQQSTGYQIQYSTGKDFAKYDTKTISDYQKNSTTIKNLKDKKTYYVRVRTYKTVGDKKYYSNWSTAKSIKTK